MVFYLYILSKVDNILELNDIYLYKLLIELSISIDGDCLKFFNGSINSDSDSSDYMSSSDSNEYDSDDLEGFINSNSDNEDCKSLEST